MKYTKIYLLFFLLFIGEISSAAVPATKTIITIEQINGPRPKRPAATVEEIEVRINRYLTRSELIAYEKNPRKFTRKYLGAKFGRNEDKHFLLWFWIVLIAGLAVILL
jgi:hypothetical protein